MRLGVVGHRRYVGLTSVLKELSELAPRVGVTLHVERDLHDLATAAERLDGVDDIDALLTLGGDGTMLRGARLLGERSVPILGINLGRLGFLTCCPGDEVEGAVRRLAAGEFTAETRMALEARVLDSSGRPTDGQSWRALNDIVLHKGGFARVVRFRVAVDGETVAIVGADGVVVSTPTGSTAYSMSAGGPVVVPTVECTIVTPVAPHTLAIRPLVVRASSEVTLQPDDAPEELLVTVDGQVGATFAAGQVLSVRRAATPVQIVRFTDTTFFMRLRHKLGWGGLEARDEALPS